MKTQEKIDLIENVKRLNDEEKYQEVIYLLPDEVLEKYNDYELYAEVSQAKFKEEKDFSFYAKKSFEIKENAKAYNYFGNFIGLSDNKKAKVYYYKAIEIDDKFVNSYANLGNSYAKDEDYESAIKYYKIALDFDSQNYKWLHNIASVYLRNNMFNEAKVYLDKAIAIKPEISSIYNTYGILYLWQEDEVKAGENFRIALKFDQRNYQAYHNLAGVLFNQKKYSDSKENYKKSISFRKERDSYCEIAESQIAEINKILANEDYKQIQEIVSKIKEILEHKDKCITHFTSLSVAKLLIFERSKFRLSEGAYLNDTSEGRELFSFLDYQSPYGKKETPVDEIFVQKPFIGSFVSQSNHNNLTMWRMYGKEGKDEAKGCAITMNVKNLIEQIQEQLGINNLEENEFETKFYKVAYWKDDKFIIPDEKLTSTKIKNLNKSCVELKKALNEFNLKEEEIKIQIDVEELLFEIAFLFKGIEYQYEHEVRLVQKGVGFEKTIDKNSMIPRVYIELGDVSRTIEKITLGPKVERADEWASAFHYELKNKDVRAEIHISRQPFK